MISRPAVLSFAMLAIVTGARAGASPPAPTGAMTMTPETTLTAAASPAPTLDAPAIATAAATVQPAVDTSIRRFQFHASDADLADLKRRILATRWPEKEPVADTSQ